MFVVYSTIGQKYWCDERNAWVDDPTNIRAVNIIATQVSDLPACPWGDAAWVELRS